MKIIMKTAIIVKRHTMKATLDIITGDENDYPCMGGELNSGCPFSFKYKIEKNELQKVPKNK